MNAATRREIFRRLQEDNPTPTTELVYNTPFELL
ncbi:endonuclease III, partial [Azotobacter chroococcum]|nr:endonuclease III [Azotobacter chroococcum]